MTLNNVGLLEEVGRPRNDVFELDVRQLPVVVKVRFLQHLSVVMETAERIVRKNGNSPNAFQRS